MPNRPAITAHVMNTSLMSCDLEMFAAIGVDAELLERFRVRRVTHEEAPFVCGIRYRSDHLEGVAFPYVDPDSGHIVAWRLRRDNPEVETDGTPIAKYVSSPDPRHFYFAPDVGPLLKDASIPVVIVEAEKSVLAVTAAADRAGRPVVVVGCGGCWGWRGRSGKTTNANGARVDEKGPVPDFARVEWRKRDVVIAFDANAATNAQVQSARSALAAVLTGRGGEVRIAELPTEDAVNGPDDYLAKHGGPALFALVDAAKPAAKGGRRPPRPKQGREVIFEEPEPWPDPVDGAALVEGIAAIFDKYIALPDGASTALALWALHAFAFEAWFTSPTLCLTSPTKRCGKTLALIVLGALVSRRLFASNVTAAVLYRAIEKYQPVLLIDEADSFIRESDELRGVLNSGHTKTTAMVLRAVGEDHDPRMFSTWCAKAIALIGKLPATLADRAIEIPMRRRTSKERVQRLRQDRIEGECLDLRRQAVRWAGDHLTNLRAADPDVPATLHDREADCWRCLLAVADEVGGHWPTRARAAATALSGDVTEDDDLSLELLHDVRQVFEDLSATFLASKVLVKTLAELDSRPWGDWRHGKPITTRAVADRLRPFGVVPVSNGSARGYHKDRFEDAWRRYPLLKASSRQAPNNDGGEVPLTNRQADSAADTLRSGETAIKTGMPDALTVSRGGEPSNTPEVVEI